MWELSDCLIVILVVCYYKFLSGKILKLFVCLSGYVHEKVNQSWCLLTKGDNSEVEWEITCYLDQLEKGR